MKTLGQIAWEAFIKDTGFNYTDFEFSSYWNKCLSPEQRKRWEVAASAAVHGYFADVQGSAISLVNKPVNETKITRHIEQ